MGRPNVRRARGLRKVILPGFVDAKTLPGLLILTFVVIVAVLAAYVAPFDPTDMHPPDRLQPPSFKYMLGTDFYGRDILCWQRFGFEPFDVL